MTSSWDASGVGDKLSDAAGRPDTAAYTGFATRSVFHEFIKYIDHHIRSIHRIFTDIVHARCLLFASNARLRLDCTATDEMALEQARIRRPVYTIDSSRSIQLESGNFADGMEPGFPGAEAPSGDTRLTELSSALEYLVTGCETPRSSGRSHLFLCDSDIGMGNASAFGAYTGNGSSPASIFGGEARDESSSDRRLDTAQHSLPSAGAGLSFGSARLSPIFEDDPFARSAIQSAGRFACFYFDHVHGTKTGQGSTQGRPGAGFEKSRSESEAEIYQRLHGKEDISDGGYSHLDCDTPGRRLDYHDRCHGGIYDDTHTQTLLEDTAISSIRPRWCSTDISIQSSVLRQHGCALDLDEIHETDYLVLPSCGADSLCDSAGRLDCIEPRPRSECKTDELCPGPFGIFGLDFEGTEMQTYTVATAQMGGGINRFRGYDTRVTQTETTGHQQTGSSIFKEGSSKRKRYNASVCISAGNVPVHTTDGSSLPVTNTVFDAEDARPAVRPHMGGSSVGQSDSSLYRYRDPGNPMVGNIFETEQRPAYIASRSAFDYNYGRINYGRRHDDTAKLAHVEPAALRQPLALQTIRDPLAHQPQGRYGTAAGAAGSTGRVAKPGPAKDFEHGMVEQDGQHNSSYLHSEAGRKENRVDVGREKGAGLLRQPSDLSYFGVPRGRPNDNGGSGLAVTRDLRPPGMADQRRMVSILGPPVGTAHGGRLCIESQSRVAAMVQPVPAGGDARQRLSAFQSQRRERVGQPAARHDTTLSSSYPQIQYSRNADHSSSGGCVDTIVTTDVDRATGFHQRPQPDAASHSRPPSKSSSDVLEIHGLASLTTACKLRGLNAAASAAVLGQWRTDKSLPGHCTHWNKFWVPYCREQNISSIVYNDDPAVDTTTAVHLANCIADAQQDSAVRAIEKGKDPQHSILKKIRAAVSRFMKVLHPEKPELTFTADVRATAKHARLVAPMQKRYSHCFDISVIFDLLEHWYNTGQRNEHMPLKQLRAKSGILARIQTSCRSDDATKVHRQFASNSGRQSHAGLFSADGSESIEQWRYFRPKNVGSLAGNMSAWVSLGAATFDTAEATEKFCTIFALQTYKMRTDVLPRQSICCEINGSGNISGDYPLFIALRPNPKTSLYEGIGANTFAKQMLWVMGLAGIDIEMYKAHVLRHSSLQAKLNAGVERDVFLTSAKMSGEVFEKYYNVPVLNARRSKVSERMFSATAAGGSGDIQICD